MFGTPTTQRTRTRRLGALAGLIAGTLVIGLAGCSSSSSDTSAAPASAEADYGDSGIALSWIKNYEFAGYYLADQNDYYSEEGFNSMNLIAGGGDTNSWDTVLAGNAIFGLASDLLGPSTAINQGADLVVVGAQFVQSPVGIVSLAGNPINTVADIVGKTFGVDNGGKAIIESILTANGYSADDATFESVPDGIDPLMDGTVDALVGFQTNYPVAVKTAGGDPVVLSLSDAGFAQVGDAVVTTRETLENNRDELKAALIASIKGWNDALTDSTALVDAAMEYGADNDLDRSLQESSAALVPSFMLTDDTVKNGIFTISDSLADGSIQSLAALGTDISKDKLFDLSLMQEIYAENPDLIPGFTVPSGD